MEFNELVAFAIFASMIIVFGLKIGNGLRKILEGKFFKKVSEPIGTLRVVIDDYDKNIYPYIEFYSDDKRWLKHEMITLKVEVNHVGD